MKPWQTQLKWDNDRPYPVTVKIYKDGTLFMTQTVPANTFWAFTVQDTAEIKPVYSYIAGVDGLAFDVGTETWSTAAAGVFHTATSGVVSASKVAEELSSHTPTDANTTTLPPASATSTPAAMPTGARSGTAWRSAGTSGGTNYTGPTDAIFREGIGKITERLDIGNTKQGEAIDELKKGTSFLEKLVQPNGNLTQSQQESVMTTNANTLKQLAMDTVLPAVTAAMSLEPAAATAPSPSGSNVLLSIKMPGGSFKDVKATGVVGAIDSGATWCREVFLWGMALLFIMAAQTKFERYNIAIAAVPQLTTNTDIASATFFGGLAKQGIMAGLVMGVVVAFVTGLVVYMNSKLAVLTSTWTFQNIGNIGNLLVGGGYSDHGNTAFAIIDRWFPIWASIQFSVAWIGLGLVAVASFITAAAIVRVVRF